MKKFLIAAIAASLTAGPLLAVPAAAQTRHTETVVRERPNGTVVTRTTTRTPDHRAWRRGERFDSHQARNYRQIEYRRYHGLRAPPRGYRWVQSGNDAVLVGITSGIIASVMAGAVR